MLFAAGLGTRLRPFTEIRPKPCITMLGIPMGYYLFPYLEHLIINQFVVNTFYLPQKVHHLFQQAEKKTNYKINFSNEELSIKGSAGGLKLAEYLFAANDNPVLLCNSDEVFFTSESDFLKSALNKHLMESNFATLIVTEHPEAGISFGAIWADEKGSVIAIGKNKPALDCKAWHFIGLQILDQKIFSFIEENKELNIFYDVLIHHLNTKRIRIYPVKADWFETGNKNNYLLAKEKISNNRIANQKYQLHIKKLEDFCQSLDIDVCDIS